jgi:hypothetical protein
MDEGEEYDEEMDEGEEYDGEDMGEDDYSLDESMANSQV